MNNGQVHVSIQKKTGITATAIRKTVLKTQDLLGFELEELTISLIDNSAIHQVNKEYLKHDYPTDIITFDYSESLTKKLDGEILISYETAAENAEKFNVSLENEITRLVIHGVLHLLGYDDTTPAKKRVMKNKENTILKKVLES